MRGPFADEPARLGGGRSAGRMWRIRPGRSACQSVNAALPSSCAGVSCAVDSEDAANAENAANAPNVASAVYFCIGEVRRCLKYPVAVCSRVSQGPHRHGDGTSRRQRQILPVPSRPGAFTMPRAGAGPTAGELGIVASAALFELPLMAIGSASETGRLTSSMGRHLPSHTICCAISSRSFGCQAIRIWLRGEMGCRRRICEN